MLSGHRLIVILVQSFAKKIFIPFRVLEPNPKAHPRTQPGISYETMGNNVSLRGVGGEGGGGSIQSTLDISKSKFISNYRYLKVNFQSKFSGTRKFTLRYQ